MAATPAIRDGIDRAIARTTVGKLLLRVYDVPLARVERRIRDLSDAELEGLIAVLEKFCGMRE